ncbi:hypothetical protein KFL_000080490 [Klebsormidium nitens]|uniref:Uncharacterized protein n=1 Tax=Klebsormidium nitens TaxID=105231 RepID=A0A1Y1HJQ8_KLENI|nr:hypothetical protein KFL_000080490 [Klebsormidium nitens]|eukprot:GAQ78143.1 hypothetical protein KFL_000080490 [Klebsormidium nitens]
MSAGQQGFLASQYWRDLKLADRRTSLSRRTPNTQQANVARMAARQLSIIRLRALLGPCMVIHLLHSARIAAAVVGTVDPATGLLPYHGDNGQYITSSGRVFVTYQRCPPGTFIANWTIGLSIVEGSAGTVAGARVKVVTGLSGSCFTINPPATFVRRLWGYGVAFEEVQNVSVTFAGGNSVAGTSFNGVDYAPGGLGALLGLGTATFPRATAWQDRCPDGSAIDGYTIGLYNPPLSYAMDLVTVQFSCSGVAQTTNNGNALEGPRPWYPPAAELLPIDSLDGYSKTKYPVNPSPPVSAQETWLPWHGKGDRELLEATQLTADNLLLFQTQICPVGSFMASLQIGLFGAPTPKVTYIQANCSNATTGTFVARLQPLAGNDRSGSIVTVTLSLANATRVNGSTSITAAGSHPSSLFGLGTTSILGNTWNDTCPDGQVLDGFQGVSGGLDTAVQSLRFHCSALNATPPAANASVVRQIAGNPPGPGPAPAPTALQNVTYPSAAVAEGQILDLLNELRGQQGVVNLTSTPVEKCTAAALAQARGLTFPPNCSRVDPYNPFLNCLPSKAAPVPESLFWLTYCEGPATPQEIVASWNEPEILPFSTTLNPKFVNVGISQVGAYTIGIFTSAYPPA